MDGVDPLAGVPLGVPILRRPRALAIAIVALLALVAFAPAASASEEDEGEIWQCDNTPGEVVEGIIERSEDFVAAVVERTEYVLGKAKCTTLEAFGICSDESIVTPGFPSTTGHHHPHRRVCYEYMLLGGPCAKTEKLRHYEYRHGGHEERCVPLYCGFVVEPPMRDEIRAGGTPVYRPCPPFPVS